MEIVNSTQIKEKINKNETFLLKCQQFGVCRVDN